jgi:hypothetical protein
MSPLSPVTRRRTARPELVTNSASVATLRALTTRSSSSLCVPNVQDAPWISFIISEKISYVLGNSSGGVRPKMDPSNTSDLSYPVTFKNKSEHCTNHTMPILKALVEGRVRMTHLQKTSVHGRYHLRQVRVQKHLPIIDPGRPSSSSGGDRG